MSAQNILEEAYTLINGERNKQYGDAADEFTKVAQVWSAYLDREVTAFDFVNMMNLLKTMRTRNGYHRDSYVDICGYSALAEQVHDKLEAAENHEDHAHGALVFDTTWMLPYNYSEGPDGVISVTPSTNVSVILGGDNPVVDEWLAGEYPLYKRSGVTWSPFAWHIPTLTDSERQWNWLSDETDLVYTFVDDEWWFADVHELGVLEDPWELSGVDEDGNVPADEGPFTLYTDPL